MSDEKKLMWVSVIHPEDAQGKVADLYRHVQRGKDRTTVPTTAMVFSLRPEAGIAKDDLRKAVLEGNTLGKHRTELINVAVSGLNACTY